MIKITGAILNNIIHVIHSIGYAWRYNPLTDAWRKMMKSRQVKRHIRAQHLQEHQERVAQYVREKSRRIHAIKEKSIKLERLKKEDKIRRRERIRADEKVKIYNQTHSRGPQYPPKKHNRRMTVMVCGNCGMCGPIKLVKKMLEKRDQCPGGT